ncbi:MAG: class I adenylate-forming enzyme family protein, partial [Flammeovirgaceae bacterium]
KFEANQVLELLESERATLFMAVPTMLKMMAEASQFHQVSLECMRYFIVGGEAMPIPLIEKWATKEIPIRQGFGMTEVGPNLTSLDEADAIRKKGSIGIPNFYVETKLVNEVGEEVGVNEIGELLVKGPMVTPGYWQNEEATTKAFQDGWFRTGDLLRRDEEGYLFVMDRLKNMFISGGENVYPAELEHFFRTHEAIVDVAIIGVAHPKWGEVGAAFIVTNDHDLNEAVLKQFCEGKLARYKIPKHYVFLPELPKNPTGKIDKRALQKLTESILI